MEFEYKVTVIIPVYNVEQYLEACLDSLLAQTIPQEEMEVLMINDGSPDGSLEICERYAAAHPNFKVISQENQGVSAARNNGIRNAKGKYLLYLDSDDTLSPETVKNVTDFFDEHYDEVDVVTYPLIYRRENGEDTNWRYEYLKGSGVYDLEKHPYISQTTMNICVKNRGKSTILFNTGKKRYEDQFYNLEQITRLGKIGYCKDATYFYYQRMGGVTKQNSHPYYERDSILEVYEEILMSQQGSKYSQALILYDLNWRIGGDLIYPYHFNEEKFAEYRMRLAHIIDKIDTRLILGHPHMNEVYQYYLLSLKTKNRPFVYAEEDAIVLADTSGELRRFQNVLAVITRSNLEDGKLYLLLYFKTVLAIFSSESPNVYAVINGTHRIKLDTFSSAFNSFWSRMETAEFLAAHFEIELEKVRTISFEVEFYGKIYKTKFWFAKTQGLKAESSFYLTDGTHRARAVEREIQIEKGKYTKPRPKANGKITACRALMGKSRKRIWLYGDRVGVYDNAYDQFKHDMAIQDGVERYYVFDDEEEAVRSRFTDAERKRLVRFGSPRHKLLYSNAEYVLTSFVDDVYYRPFDIDTFAYYRGVCRAKVVYLQHGVLHAKVPHYNKEKLEIDKVVISGEYEKDLFPGKCGFRATDLIPSGMPRLDKIDTSCQPQRKILCAPSWREYLTRGMESRRWQPISEDELKKSHYFTGLVAFLSDPKLIQGLRDNGYSIELKLHPIFKMYEDVFRRALPNVTFSADAVNLEEYAALVTDFSSYLFDFAYLKRPIFNFVPDLAEVKAGLNGYRELYIPLEEGLGFFSSELKDMVNEVTRAMGERFAIQPIYKKRMDRIFFHDHPSHADELYKCLIASNGNDR